MPPVPKSATKCAHAAKVLTPGMEWVRPPDLPSELWELRRELARNLRKAAGAALEFIERHDAERLRSTDDRALFLAGWRDEFTQTRRATIYMPYARPPFDQTRLDALQDMANSIAYLAIEPSQIALKLARERCTAFLKLLGMELSGLSKAGAPPRSDGVNEEILKLADGGLTPHEIAGKLNRHETASVRRTRRGNRWSRRNVTQRLKELRKKVAP
jgi:hypothetical protein